MSKEKLGLGGASLSIALAVAVSTTWVVSTGRGPASTGRRPASTTFTPTADAYVSTAHPEANYGTKPVLRTDSTPRIRSYLRFTVSDLSAPVKTATLRVWPQTSDTVGYEVHPVSSVTWTESRITAATAPEIAAGSASAGPVTARTWAAVDVTALVAGAGEVSFALTTTSRHGVAYDSREAEHPPELIIETHSRGEPRSRREVRTAPTRSLPELIEDVPGATGHRYKTRDHRGRTMDTLKVIESPAGGYLGVYHHASDGVFSTMVATSTDLLTWTYRATLDAPASQPAIAAAGSGFVVAAEIDDSGLAHPVSRWLRFRHYPSVDALLAGQPDRTFDAPPTLVPAPGGFEGTPNFFSVRLLPDLGHSAIDVGFHYYRDGVDRQGRGLLTNFSTWTTQPQPELDAALEAQGVVGNIGDRDTVVFRGASYTLVEGQLAKGDFGSWRAYLHDPRSGQTSELKVKTHKGSQAFANPTVTNLRAPSGRPALLVTMFIPAEGAGAGERGELVYFTEYGEEPESSDPVIAAAGDIACRAGEPITEETCQQQATSDLLAAIDPTAVLSLGDHQYETGRLVRFNESYEPTWGRLKAITYPTSGNHEYKTDLATGYYDYFRGAAGDRTRGYYSYNIGSWHLIALNSNCLEVGGCGPGSPQLEWLRADLAAHPRPCTLAYWHQPRFSSGEHGSDVTFHDFWQVLYDAGVDVVLNGHDHDYERFAPQDPMGQPNAIRGIRQFVIGTGGKGLDRFHTVAPNSEVRNSKTFGVLRLTLRAEGYDWRFVPVPGTSFSDAGREACH